MPFPTLRGRQVALAAAWLVVATPAAHAADIVTQTQDFGTLSVPVTRTYGHSFNDADAQLAGLQLAGIGTLAPTDTFFDDYAFNVGDASFSAFSATLDLSTVLQISGLQVRLYKGTLQTTTTGALSPEQLLVRWTDLALTASSTGGNVQLIAPLQLAPGSYVLEVRGKVTGSAGGSYAGLMNLAEVSAVPEPASLAMMLAGLGVLGWSARRRG